MSSQKSPGAMLNIGTHPTPAPGPSPRPAPVPDPAVVKMRKQLQDVVNTTSLEANAGLPARLTNLTHANVSTNINRGAQTAVANQQAHAALNLSITGKAANKVQNLSPQSARSAVDVLTNNEIAATLMSVKGAVSAFSGRSSISPTDWGVFRHTLRRLLDRLQHRLAHINEVNQHLANQDGTAQSPYLNTGYPLFVTAPVSLLFLNTDPSQLDLEVLRRMFHRR